MSPEDITRQRLALENRILTSLLSPPSSSSNIPRQADSEETSTPVAEDISLVIQKALIQHHQPGVSLATRIQQLYMVQLDNTPNMRRITGQSHANPPDIASIIKNMQLKPCNPWECRTNAQTVHGSGHEEVAKPQWSGKTKRDNLRNPQELSSASAGGSYSTGTLEATNALEATSTLEATNTPEATSTLEATDTLEATNAPEATSTPEAASTPEATNTLGAACLNWESSGLSEVMGEYLQGINDPDTMEWLTTMFP
jgi:hypothetical protein